jgi:hypothetical protein|tara:strand:+ start:6067 stop:6384 length:318 start_codon:yes stop_codon:yes gene_type:complete
MGSKKNFRRTKNITVPPSQGFKKKVLKEIFILPSIDKRKGKSRIVMDSKVKEMNERIKKKKETGKKDIFDYIGDIIKTPYIIRGGKKKVSKKATGGAMDYYKDIL